MMNEDMNRSLIERYSELTCAGVEPFVANPWPEDLFLTDNQIKNAMIRIPQHKALTFDCVPDSLFRICCKDNDAIRCYQDNRKVMLASQCFTDEF